MPFPTEPYLLHNHAPAQEPASARPSPMTCRHCAVPLVISERQGIEIDYCPTCRGIWLDRGELDKIIERAAAEMAPQAPQAPRHRKPEGAAAPTRPRADTTPVTTNAPTATATAQPQAEILDRGDFD